MRRINKAGGPSSRRVRQAAGAAAAVLLLLAGSGCVFSTPRYRGPVTDHFDGERFRNPWPHPLKSGADFWKWQRTRQRGPWRDWTPLKPGLVPPPAEAPADAIRITFINHATALIQMDGLNILTDPVYSERVTPVSFLGPRRRRPPGVAWEALPRIDAVLVSHNHYDHLDVPTLHRLGRDKGHPPIYTPLGNNGLLVREGIRNGRDMDWWHSTTIAPGVTLTLVPAQHWSSRWSTDRNFTLWGGFWIEGPSGSVYFAGDTGMGPHFAMIRQQLGQPDIALLPIGAYKPEWFMQPSHLSPAEAVEAHRILGARRSMGIHFGTFELADDGEMDPVEDLGAAVRSAQLPEGTFIAPDNGEHLEWHREP